VSISDAYTSWSESYDLDRNLTRDLDQAVTRQMLGRQRCGNILEIGCGTGKNTALLAEIGRRVLALDFSEGMLKQAREKISAPGVTFGRADLTQPWPCKSESVNLVVCNLVLEHVEHLNFIFAEASRCLASDGTLFLSELHPFRQYQGGQARFTAGPSSQVAIEAFVHNISDFFEAARLAGLTVTRFNEWWHPEDQGRPPRLATFHFSRSRTPG
jgi:malonyl-CoA O-methyltransferase